MRETQYLFSVHSNRESDSGYKPQYSIKKKSFIKISLKTVVGSYQDCIVKFQKTILP